MENQNNQQNPQEAKKPDQSKGKNRGMAIIAYIVFFVPLLTSAKDEPFVKYHVKQGLVLFIASIVVYFIARVIPLLGWIIAPILNIGLLVLFIIGIVNAINGAEKPLPLIGHYADRFKF
jgi:uncharacterized membrane protein